MDVVALCHFRDLVYGLHYFKVEHVVQSVYECTSRELDLCVVFFSGLFLQERNFTEYLGDIERDPETGLIVSAKATFIRWFGKTNVTAIEIEAAEKGGKQKKMGMDQQPVSF